MKVFESKDIRNVGLIGHKACGKTSIAEAALWSAKRTKRLGSTSDGTSVLDWEPEEQKRVMSSSSAIGSLEWKKKKINLIDTPGDGNFLKDTRTCMQAMDGVICVISSKDGVEAMTDRVHGWAVEMNLARAFFISKMDAENADFQKALEDVKENMCREASAVQIPIGQQAAFKGVVDLVAQKAYLFKDGDGGEYEETDIPADMKDAAEEARNKLIEDIASNDEALMEKFFEGSLTSEEITKGLSKSMAEGSIVPVYCGSGTTNKGVTNLLNFIVDAFPSPLDGPARVGKKGEEKIERKPAASEPLSLFVFKSIYDKLGRVSVMRVMAGNAAGGETLENRRRENQPKERLGTINTLIGKDLEAVESAPVGDIIAAAKLKEVQTFDTLSADGWVMETVSLPAPLISRALRAKEKGGEEKIMAALVKIVEEDPGLSLGRDESSGQLLVSGSGQQHIEIAAEKMGRKYGVPVDLELPRIPYQETFSQPVKNVEGKHKKQTGGSGQFGVAYMDFEPGEKGSGFVFEDAIVGGAIPRQFIPSVEKGIKKAMSRGMLAGYPVVDIKVRLFDGKYHPVDSKDVAFQMAGSKGFKQAAAKARPVLLEPIMNVEITVPEENMGDVMGDVNTRRGRLSGTNSMGKYVTIKAQMPLAEIQTYEASLRSMTQGRGSFTMELSHMETVPPPIQEKIVKDSGFVPVEDEE
jgi:elongation factor G